MNKLNVIGAVSWVAVITAIIIVVSI